MPEIGDSVRAAVAKAAGEIGIELKVTYEARSISAMKGLVMRGAASSILPYASIVEEARTGKLDSRPIAMPAIRRTLFLASSRQRGPFRCEAGLTGVVQTSLDGFLDALGALAHPLWVRAA